MVQIGCWHTLVVVSRDDRGATLLLEEQPVLLPKKECPMATRVGDELTVFVYNGRQDQLMATFNKPLAEAGQFALMRVSQSNKFGAFVDWGLDKELLVPFAEQPERLKVGRDYIVHVGIDNSGRLIGSTRIERHLDAEDIPFSPGEEVDVLIWQLTDLGAKVIVNNRYAGLIYRDDLPPDLKRGEQGKAYVLRVREDHLIDITLRKVGKAGMDEARQVVFEALQVEGRLPLTDKSSPEEIEQVLGLSKKAFKRAVGILYKERLIEIAENEIRLS
nr:S1-like domain-containing RNA-binding protein [uncultured Desulfuromonas sp.]